ncbi:MAG: hypothetical protein ACRCYO_06105 [Bacteroidia bacterium]
MSGQFMLSFDVDWVPDFILHDVLRLVQDAGVKSTWFVTHDSEAIQAMKNNALVELGLHPNYLPNSSHGNTQQEVLAYLLAVVPDAVSVRSHAVVQSGPILNYYTHTGIKIDSTIFLPEQEGIRPVTYFLPHGELIRVPFFWADDYELSRKPLPDWNPVRYTSVLGAKMMMFHPVHVFFNSPDYAFYDALKKQHPNIGQLSFAEAEQLRNTSKLGARDFLLQLLHMPELKGAPTLREFVFEKERHANA